MWVWAIVGIINSLELRELKIMKHIASFFFSFFFFLFGLLLTMGGKKKQRQEGRPIMTLKIWEEITFDRPNSF